MCDIEFSIPTNRTNLSPPASKTRLALFFSSYDAGFFIKPSKGLIQAKTPKILFLSTARLIARILKILNLYRIEAAGDAPFICDVRPSVIINIIYATWRIDINPKVSSIYV